MRTKTKRHLEIAEQFGHTRSWVQHILSTFNGNGWRLLESRHGRPRKSTKENQKVLRNLRANRGNGLKAASSELSEHLPRGAQALDGDGDCPGDTPE